MKRTILLAVLCMVCTIGLFAQKEKVVRIHKTDGTVAEYHAAAIRDFSFSGKAIVNDGDYTEITDAALALDGVKLNIDITATFNADDPYITGNEYGEDWGILYSTSPDVTIESGTLIKKDRGSISDSEFEGSLASGTMNIRWGESFSDQAEDKGWYADLEYNTTYYFRSYVRRTANNDIYEEEYFYSSEKSVSTGKPSMAYYGLTDIPSYASERGYVMPTEEAWATFDGQYPYFSLSDYRSKETVINHWNEYLTPERIDAIKAQCATQYDCAEGTLYVADAVGEDFCQYLLGIYDREFVLDGASELIEAGEATYIECDASWNVPGNGYWRYAPANLDDKVNPSVSIPLPEYMLANYYYTIEVTLAPNTDEAETLPSKVTARLLHEGAVASVLAQDQSTETDKCTVLVADSIEVERLGEGVLDISSTMEFGTRRDPKDNGKFLPVLRIAQIKVTPHKKEETAE